LSLLSIAILVSGCGSNTTSENTSNSGEKQGGVKKIKEETIINDDPIALSPKTVFKYNENGKITDEYYYDKGDVLKSHNQYTYNESGNVTELKRISPTQVYNSKVTYTYNSSNKILKEISYDSNNIASSEATYTYDAEGNILKIEFTKSFTYKHEYVYDENKKLKSIIYFNEDGTKDTEKPKENGRYENDKNNTYKYDDKNNLIEETHDASYGFSKFTTEYDYNEKGEWLKKRTFYSDNPSEKGELKSTTTKEITYYP
jgi:hypothetical protein